MLHCIVGRVRAKCIRSVIEADAFMGCVPLNTCAQMRTILHIGPVDSLYVFMVRELHYPAVLLFNSVQFLAASTWFSHSQTVRTGRKRCLGVCSGVFTIRLAPSVLSGIPHAASSWNQMLKGTVLEDCSQLCCTM